MQPNRKSLHSQPRTFGVWTFLSALIRYYAAYRLHDYDWYVLGHWMFVFAIAHFGSVLLIFGAVKPSEGGLLTAVVAVLGTV